MDLHIKDRIYIPQMLPQQNNFMGFNLKREIIKKWPLQKPTRIHTTLRRTPRTAVSLGILRKTERCL